MGVLRQVGVPCRRRMLAEFAGVISHMPVSGQLAGRPLIHNHWSAFRRTSFRDGKQPMDEKPRYRQLRIDFRIAVICSEE
jgi:hypothetical protein